MARRSGAAYACSPSSQRLTTSSFLPRREAYAGRPNWLRARSWPSAALLVLRGRRADVRREALCAVTRAYFASERSMGARPTLVAQISAWRADCAVGALLCSVVVGDAVGLRRVRTIAVGLASSRSRPWRVRAVIGQRGLDRYSRVARLADSVVKPLILGGPSRRRSESRASAESCRRTGRWRSPSFSCPGTRAGTAGRAEWFLVGDGTADVVYTPHSVGGYVLTFLPALVICSHACDGRAREACWRTASAAAGTTAVVTLACRQRSFSSAPARSP